MTKKPERACRNAHPWPLASAPWCGVCRFVLAHPDFYSEPATQTGPVPVAENLTTANLSSVLPEGGGGPGTELKLLLSSLGVSVVPGCGCEDRTLLMDGWGPVGCRVRRWEIVTWLKQAVKQSPILRLVRAGAFAFLTNPTDPVGGLVDEAIRRAEAKNAAVNP